jgi:hypothetical protein
MPNAEFDLEVVPFADIPALEQALREVELEGRLVTGFVLNQDNTDPTRFVEGYSFILPPEQQPPPIMAKQVPTEATTNNDAFKTFIAPLLQKATMFARGDMRVGGKTIDVALFREAPEIKFPPTNGMLRGDGTWPWFATIQGDDLVVVDAKSTCFGGGDDPQDSGETASGVRTKGKDSLQGCALPMRYSGASEKLRAALGGSPIPKMPFGLKRNGQDDPNGAHVEVTDRATGKKITVPVIDLGPAKKTGHPLDLTIASAKEFNPSATARNFSMRLDFRIIGGKRFVDPAEITGVPRFAGASVVAGTFIQKLVASTEGEIVLVGQTHETSSPLKERIKKYWTEIGLPFPGVAEAWSAVFVSWNVRQAGATEANFTFAESHSAFVHAAINGTNAQPAFRGRKITDYAPKAGDIIQNNRLGNTFDFSHAGANKSYKSHSAIVVEIGARPQGGRFAMTIGGNEDDGVRRRQIDLDADGKLVQPEPKHFICVLENLIG